MWGFIMYRSIIRIALLVSSLAACGGVEGDEAFDSSNNEDTTTEDSNNTNFENTGSSQLGLYKSGSRLKMRIGSTTDGSKMFLGWHDSKKGDDCWFYWAGDGKQRCLPGLSASVSDHHFSDSSCTQELAVMYWNHPQNCGHIPKYAYKTMDACPSGRILFPIGQQHVAQVYEIKYGNSECVPATPVPDAQFWTLGGEIPPSEWVEQKESIE